MPTKATARIASLRSGECMVVVMPVEAKGKVYPCCEGADSNSKRYWWKRAGSVGNGSFPRIRDNRGLLIY